MKTFLESISLGSGAVLIAVLSVGVVWLLCSVLPVAFRWLSVVIVPFLLAYSLYWLPVWLGSDDVAQYDAWQVLGVGVWFLSGAIPSTMLVTFLGKRRAK
jgi:hypothetical protein